MFLGAVVSVGLVLYILAACVKCNADWINLQQKNADRYFPPCFCLWCGFRNIFAVYRILIGYIVVCAGHNMSYSNRRSSAAVPSSGNESCLSLVCPVTPLYLSYLASSSKSYPSSYMVPASALSTILFRNSTGPTHTPTQAAYLNHSSYSLNHPSSGAVGASFPSRSSSARSRSIHGVRCYVAW